MVLRSLGKVVRGKATPGQMMLACVLGSLLGFLPGLARAPGLFVVLICALLVLNASLPLALLTWPLAKLVSWLLLPVAFHLGRALLDGPLQGLFATLVNLPVVALFGLEYYVVTGGLPLAVLFGLGVGLLVTRAVARIRKTMAGVESSSAAYQKIKGKWWAALLAWALIGGRRGKLTWADLATQTKGRPIRLWGAGIVAVLLISLVALQSVLAGPLLGRALKSGLERVNGATVDVGSASLDLAGGKLVVTDLALADSSALDRDALRVGRLEADLSTADLLRKRVRLERVVLSEAHQGLPRTTPGERVGPKTPEGDARDSEAESGGPRTLEDYIASAQEWRERLRQIRRVLDGLAGDGDDSAAGEGEAGESPTDRARRQAELMGYADVTAAHLVQGSPTLEIAELIAEGVTSVAMPGETFDVRAEHLSTHPPLAGGPPRVLVTSRSGVLSMDLGLAALAGHAGSNRVLFDLKGLAVDRIAGSLAVGGGPPLSGGTLDVLIDGTWSGGRVGYLDLPLNIALHDTTLNLGGSARQVAEFRLPLGLRGPIDDPEITIDDTELSQALKNAGAAELARRVDEKQAEVLGEAQDKLSDKVGEKVGDKLGDKLGGLLGGKKKKD
ncbi:MAG: hypothetical protein ACT4PU_11375 [Planctomycetota bacterium]